MAAVVTLRFKGGAGAAARRIHARAPREKRVELAHGVVERVAGLVLGSIVWSASVALFVFY